MIIFIRAINTIVIKKNYKSKQVKTKYYNHFVIIKNILRTYLVFIENELYIFFLNEKWD